jgi:hypothetical protein
MYSPATTSDSETVRRRTHVVPLALALGALAVFAAWGLFIVAGIWAAVVVALALIDRLVLHRLGRIAAVVVPIATVPVLWLFTFEGGLFFIPSAVALAVGHALDRAP